jgi:hypothetical protein
MSNFKGLKLSRLFLVILVSLVYLTALPSPGHCDDWIYVGQNDYFSLYYNYKTLKIDTKSKTIKVWVKRIFTDKQKEIDKSKNKIIATSTLILYDYDNMKFNILLEFIKFMSGNITKNNYSDIKWENIISGSVSNDLLIKILKNDNIER